MTALDDFETLVRTRRAVRHFKPDPLPGNLLERLVGIAQWAPSGYNMQPTHVVAVTDAALKPALRAACMDQKQVETAPATLVFCGDRRAAERNFERVLEMDRAAGAVNAEYEAKLREFVPLAFGQGPFGIGWLWKALLPPLGRMVRPIPSIPAVHKNYWLAKQVALNAMVFMLAAHAAGLATVPMEGFDETRVQKVLGIPRGISVVLVVPVGYAATGALTKSRLPLESMLHKNGWNGTR